MSAAAKYLGLTEAQLFKQLSSGKSLAQIATARGKSVSGLKAAMTAAVKAKLDKALANKMITSAQEQKLLGRLSSVLDAQINRKGLVPHFAPGFRRRSGGRLFPSFAPQGGASGPGATGATGPAGPAGPAAPAGPAGPHRHPLDQGRHRHPLDQLGRHRHPVPSSEDLGGCRAQLRLCSPDQGSCSRMLCFPDKLLRCSHRLLRAFSSPDGELTDMSPNVCLGRRN